VETATRRATLRAELLAQFKLTHSHGL